MISTLHAAWLATAERAPNAIAMIDAATQRSWTRLALHQRAVALRDQLPAAATRRTILLAQPNGTEWIAALLACLAADSAVAPIDPGEPETSRALAAETAGASFIWDENGVTSLRLRRPQRDHRRVIKFTSGSTQRPRALRFTDAQMLADGAHVCSTMGLTADDRNYALIPFGHSYGWGNLVVPLLAQGTAIVCGSSALPHVATSEVERFQATVFPAVPALLRAWAESDIAPEHLRSLRTIISAGAPLAPETARAFFARFGKKIHSFYGSSETGGITYDRTGDAALTGRSVGTPLDGVSLTFLPRRRFTVTSAAVGDRRGSHLAADFGELTPDGELRLLARRGRIAKIAGRRVNLAEVEETLRRVPHVLDAFVAPHPTRADALAAAVAGRVESGQLRSELARHLAPWKIPRQFLVLTEFPLTARGKTDTRRLLATLREAGS